MSNGRLREQDRVQRATSAGSHVVKGVFGLLASAPVWQLYSTEPHRAGTADPKYVSIASSLTLPSWCLPKTRSKESLVWNPPYGLPAPFGSPEL